MSANLNLPGMKPTKGKKYVDSNVFLYALDKDAFKKSIALDIMESKPIISTQVINENIHSAIKKFLPKEEAFIHAELLIKMCDVKKISIETIRIAFKISSRYQYSYFDSLQIAAALENNCSILYSEDLQHKQVIEGKLTIVNPFL